MPRQARENTLASFELALAADAGGIELDVHVSRDGIVVVRHDAWLEGESAERGPALADLTASDLARYGVPPLDDVCELVGDRVALYVEAKAPRSAAAIVECLTGHQVRAAVHSFDHRVVHTVRELAPALPVGVLMSSYLMDPRDPLRTTGARDLWQHWELIDAELVNAVHAIGSRIVAWTVNDLSDARRLSALGVDAICTDDVRALASALDLTES
ncbi:MAG: glycerophosphodiester phosphodiesterase [Gemmatimonadaceae bacterium]